MKKPTPKQIEQWKAQIRIIREAVKGLRELARSQRKFGEDTNGTLEYRIRKHHMADATEQSAFRVESMVWQLQKRIKGKF